MQPQTFDPDHDYCVHCHAPAAGPCADCGALCCGDCVEVVQRFTSRRAVCRVCLGQEPLDEEPRRWPWLVLGVGMLAALLAWSQS